MKIKQLSSEVEKFRNEVLTRRDNICRTLGIDKGHPFLKEQNDNLNEVSQLICYTRSGLDDTELNQLVEERLHDLRFGKLNENNIRPSIYGL